VQGRSSTPPQEIEVELTKLISGQLSHKERHQACDLLRNEPEWLGWMADQIKKRRSQSVSKQE